MAARQAIHQPARPGEPERSGSVALVRYDTCSMTGIVSFGSGVGLVAAPLGASAMRKSGLWPHPTQFHMEPNTRAGVLRALSALHAA
jgi:hypothetical protein